MQIPEGYSISAYTKHCLLQFSMQQKQIIKAGCSSYYNHTLIMFKFGEVLVEATAAILLGQMTPVLTGSKNGRSTESVIRK